MKHKFRKILCVVILIMGLKIILADNNQPTSNLPELPAIETVLLEPIELENTDIWVPAAKIGPLINRSCRAKENCSYSFLLPASVHHTKTRDCPEEVARLLAEYAAVYHEKTLPLTIFNGWQWEYYYSLCQFESAAYDLPRRGGCWENSWEAILTLSAGSADFQRVHVAPSGNFPGKPDNSKQKSNIEVKTFSSMRMRDGYPKERQL